MTATTPTFAIPYPEITDFVKDGATAMEAIAERLDDVLTAQVANRNLVYNGAMQVVQRATNISGITGSGLFTTDRWRIFLNTAGTWTQTADTDVPTGQGFRRCTKMLCTTAKTPLSAGDFLGFHQRLEGQDLQAIRKGTASAKQLTVGFWVKSNKTGTYIFELLDSDNNRSISKSYTINSSGVWEYKTITMAADTTGTLNNDNDTSLEVIWWLSAGSTYNSGSLQTSWGTVTNGGRAFGQTNLADTVNNYWQITGVQLLIGAVDAPFQFKSYQQELRECQRYYYTRSQVGGYNHVEGLGVGVNFNNGFFFQAQHPVEMRAAPVYARVSGGTAVDAYGFASGVTYASQQMTTKGGRVSFTSAGLTDYRPYFFIGNPDVTIEFSAEL